MTDVFEMACLAVYVYLHVQILCLVIVSLMLCCYHICTPAGVQLSLHGALFLDVITATNLCFYSD